MSSILIAAVLAAAAPLSRPGVPAAIAVPEGNEVGFVGHATGVQIYECAQEPGHALAWRLRAPRADLSDGTGKFAHHYGGVDAGLPAGPWWESNRDGSRVRAGNVASSANPGAIPLLRLQAVEAAGKGIFAGVSYIQRLATSGGVGPSGACENAGARIEVPYTADYFFYRPAR